MTKHLKLMVTEPVSYSVAAKTIMAGLHRLRRSDPTSEQELVTAVKNGSKRQMARRHVAEHRARIAKQREITLGQHPGSLGTPSRQARDNS